MTASETEASKEEIAKPKPQNLQCVKKGPRFIAGSAHKRLHLVELYHFAKVFMSVSVRLSDVY